MGVMPCERNGCEHIMCKILIDNKYICDSCFIELQNSKGRWPTDLTKEEVRQAVRTFLDTEAGPHDTEANFNSLVGQQQFRRRYHSSGRRVNRMKALFHWLGRNDGLILLIATVLIFLACLAFLVDVTWGMPWYG